MNLVDALSPHSTLEEITGMLVAGERHEQLRGELSAMLAAGYSLERCEVRHARFRPGHKLRANFDVRVRSGADGRQRVRAIEVTWRPPKDKDRPPKRAEDLGALQEEAVRHGVAAPFHRLMADRPLLGMQVRVSPLDVDFPQLARMSDPAYVDHVVGGLSSPDDARRGQTPTDPSAVTCIRYRPGRRHVLRYDAGGSRESRTLFGKMYAGQKGERAFRVANTVAGWLAQHGQGVTALRPLAYLADDSVVLYRGIVGECLSPYLQRSGHMAGPTLAAVGTALRALHELPCDLIEVLTPHDLAAEVKQIKRSREHLPALLPSSGAVVDALLARALELDERLPREEPVFTHGDFISEHIWVTSEGPVFIDFDNCFLADRALDIGKFLADLQLVYATCGRPGVEAAQDAFLTGYGLEASSERLLRARLYEAIKLAKMAARRVYVFEADWAPRTARLIARAQALMTDLERTLGLAVDQVSA
jgi:aminoglycoside phosphotransferase (APT) family kinase protein